MTFSIQTCKPRREIKGSLDFQWNQSFSAHARHFSKVTCQALCLKCHRGLPLMCANSVGSGETARMRRLARTFAVRICYSGAYHKTDHVLALVFFIYLFCANWWDFGAFNIYVKGNRYTFRGGNSVKIILSSLLKMGQLKEEAWGPLLTCQSRPIIWNLFGVQENKQTVAKVVSLYITVKKSRRLYGKYGQLAASTLTVNFYRGL